MPGVETIGWRLSSFPELPEESLLIELSIHTESIQ
jgi:hypothetical protein